ncbi:MAG TPA: response regulator [Planctomycetaceae bacterium]|nr:response regulator [Planctomycetaceae bacterium]
MESRSKVLLIDDDVEVHRLVTNLLRSEFLVFTARDGVDGVLKAQRFPPDVVLLDIDLAHKYDGFKTLAALKQLPRMGDIPILMFTADSSTKSAHAARAAGAAGYILKHSLTPAQFVARVQFAVAHAASTAS